MQAELVRSPIKEPIPRQPGQYLDELVQDELWEEGGSLITVAGIAMFAVVIEWIRFALALEPHPYIASAMGLVVLLLVIRRIKSLKKKWCSIRQGRDGERYVAQVLDSLIAQDAQVIHDIPADGFNLDHVVIGPFGIWMVETKTISKPVKGRSEIIYSDSGLIIDGGPVTVASIEQATAQAQWLQKRIKELTGLEVPVRPVVIYAGWYIKCEKPWTKPVWVMHEQSFVTMVLRESCQVSEVDRKAIGFHLRRMANSQIQNRNGDGTLSTM